MKDNSDKYSIRTASLKDTPDLVRLRRIMFISMGVQDKDSLDKGDSAVTEYFQRTIPTKEFLAWVVENGKGNIIACGGLVIDQHPPGPRNFTGKVGYIMNLVVDEDYRNNGIATRIMNTILAYIKEKEISFVSLHATEMGRSIYEKFGFNSTNEMRLVI
ncbi:MAG: GNAT family N-acetyltransferase [Candidatus Thorarchaeota archaeon]